MSILNSRHAPLGAGCPADTTAWPSCLLPHTGLPLEAAAAGVVGTSVSGTLDWLRSCCRQQPALQLEVLITGSLYLVGDVLRALGKEPE